LPAANALGARATVTSPPSTAGSTGPTVPSFAPIAGIVAQVTLDSVHGVIPSFSVRPATNTLPPSLAAWVTAFSRSTALVTGPDRPVTVNRR
jgi:hypothetical protein